MQAIKHASPKKNTTVRSNWTALLDAETNCMDLPKYINRAQAAKRYGVSIRKLDYLIEDGIIPAARLGKRCLRIPVHRADEVIARLVTGGAR